MIIIQFAPVVNRYVILWPQDDESTPVHLACAQGSLDMIQVMFELQPENKEKSLSSCDVMMRTPLHIAALYDNVHIVEYLAQQVNLC